MIGVLVILFVGLFAGIILGELVDRTVNNLKGWNNE